MTNDHFTYTLCLSPYKRWFSVITINQIKFLIHLVHYKIYLPALKTSKLKWIVSGTYCINVFYLHIIVICTLWTPFQAERDWKNSYREILQIPLQYVFYSLWFFVYYTLIELISFFLSVFFNILVYKRLRNYAIIKTSFIIFLWCYRFIFYKS